MPTANRHLTNIKPMKQLLPLAILIGISILPATFHAQPSLSANQMSAAMHSGFEENRGQITDEKNNAVPFVLYRFSSAGMNVYITETGVTYVLMHTKHDEAEARDHLANGGKAHNEPIDFCRIDMQLEGASINVKNVVTELPQNAASNYYLAHCPQGIQNVKKYGKLTFRSVYPGIDWVWHFDETKGLKYDFIVHPGADPSLIQMVYRWADMTAQDDNQSLLLKTPVGEVQEGKLSSFSGGQQVKSNYRVDGKRVSFELGTYDKKQDLVIDPPLALMWGTYFGGGTWEKNTDISHTIDGTGNVFVTCNTISTDFPVVNPGGGAYFQGTYGGGNAGIQNKGGDAVIMKFNNSGVLLWSTFYGGTEDDNGTSIDCDASGFVYATGSTLSPNFPTQNLAGAYFQGTYGGGTPFNNEGGDAYILKFDNAGQRLWATFYGGSGDENAYSLRLDATNNIYLTGSTASANFPVLNPGGTAYFQAANGGSTDAFVVKLDVAGAQQWSTYYGGAGIEIAQFICIDGVGKIHVTGSAEGAGMPTTDPGNGAYYQPVYGGTAGYSYYYRGDGGDAFILRFSSLLAIEWATYYGGTGDDAGRGLDVDAQGNIYVTGDTRSSNFGVQNPGGGAYYQGALNGSGDAFFLMFNSSCVRQWGTFFGGAADDWCGVIKRDACGNIYAAGHTTSTDMPTVDFGGSAYYVGAHQSSDDVFFLMFNSSLALAWATYDGTVGFDEKGTAIEIDPSGRIFIVGYWCFYSTSTSVMNPGGGAYYKTNVDADDFFIAKFDAMVGGQVTVSPTFANVQCNGSCDGTATASVSGSCAPPYSYLWQPGGQTTQTITGLCPGSYSVTVTDAASSTATSVITITEPGPFNATVNGNFTINSGDMTQLTATGGGSYLWSTGDTTGSITVSPTSNTVYNVIVTDPDGCSDTIFVTVDILCGIIVPNVFSPNGDGDNEYFVVASPCIRTLQYDIYNRWGQLIYTSGDLQGWNGRVFNGKMASDGTYYYVLSGVMIDESQFLRTGFLTLLKDK